MAFHRLTNHGIGVRAALWPWGGLIGRGRAVPAWLPWLVLLSLPLPGAPALPGLDGVVVEEFGLEADGSSWVVRVASPPPAGLAERPMALLFFSTDRRDSLPGGRYGAPALMFLKQGHRIISFDLPAHGDRVDHRGQGIAGLAARWALGDDPFGQFVAEGRRVVDACVSRGLAPGGVVAAGVSRGGYFALRLAAADERVMAVAALAPVTDWRELAEFSTSGEESRLEALALTHYAERLVGRPLYLAMGNLDHRVGTTAGMRFMLAVVEAEHRARLPGSRLAFHVVNDSPGHNLAGRWREAGIDFLLSSTERMGHPPANLPTQTVSNP